LIFGWNVNLATNSVPAVHPSGTSATQRSPAGNSASTRETPQHGDSGILAPSETVGRSSKSPKSDTVALQTVTLPSYDGETSSLTHLYYCNEKTGLHWWLENEFCHYVTDQ
jgi:hypothetical protein